MDYGTILVPAGTQVFRHNVNGKVSDWWVADSELAKFCPILMPSGDPSHMFMLDATNYGISLPNANVCPVNGPYVIGHSGEIAETFHKAHHY